MAIRQIQFRRDTTSAWSGSNPVLRAGEPAYDTDLGTFKIGDGIHPYNELTGSFIDLSNVIASGSFNGEFIGDGSQLSGVLSAVPPNIISGSDQISGSFIQTGGTSTLTDPTLIGDLNIMGVIAQTYESPLVNTEIYTQTITSGSLHGQPAGLFTVGVQNNVDGGPDYKGAYTIQKFDSDEYNYGAEIINSGEAAGIKLYSSGSSNIGSLRLVDISGSVQFRAYGTEMQIGAYAGVGGTSEYIWIGNETLLKEVQLRSSGSIRIFAGDNIMVTGSIDVQGDVSAAYFVGDGSQLTNVQHPTGTISGSDQVTSSLDDRYQMSGSDIPLPDGTVSGSTQITDGSTILSGSKTNITSLNTFTSSIQTEVDGISSVTSSYLTEIPSGIISGSSQLTGSYDTRYTISGSISSLPDDIVSGSTQIDHDSTTNYNPLEHFTSASLNISASQIVDLEYTDISELNTFTASIQSEVDVISSVTSSYLTDLPSGTVSGSTQITDGSTLLSGSKTDITQLNTFTSSIQTEVDNISAVTSSYLANTTDTLDGDLTVTGTITANEFHTEFVSSSIIYESGSTKFGDTSDDIHEFTGSVSVQGTITATQISGMISGSSQLTSSYDTRYQLSGSEQLPIGVVSGSTQITDGSTLLSGSKTNIDELNTFTSSIQTEVDGISAATSSYEVHGSGIVSGSSQLDGTTINNLTGSFSGSFVGDGSQLSGVTSYTDTDTENYINSKEVISGSYNPTVADNVTTATTHGGILAGTTAGLLASSSYDELFTNILFPTVLAYIDTAKSVSVSGHTTQTLEVGTSITPSVTTTFNRGLIDNGDGSSGPDLVGLPSLYEYRFPGGSLDESVSNTSLSDVHIYNSTYVVQFGSNVWSVDVVHDAGTGLYYDNKSAAGTNLDASRVSGTVSRNMNTKTGRYYAWDDYGVSGSSETTSAGVRSLGSKRFLGGSNTGTFNITIPSGTQEVSFYCPAGKTITVLYVESSNADVTGTFTETQFNVDDANGSSVSYDSWVSFIGLTGYPSIATYNVTIS